MGAVVLIMATALAAVGVADATAEPLTLDHLLAQEDLGRIQMDASGTRLVVEQLAPHAALPRFDFQAENWRQGSRLLFMKLPGGNALEPLLPDEPGSGYSAGPFSPSGRRMAIYQLRDSSWRLGIVDMDAKLVVWTRLSPALPGRGRALVWRSDDSLVVLASESGNITTPSRVRLARFRLARLWAEAAAGVTPAMTTVSTIDRSGAGSEEARLWLLDARSGVGQTLALDSPADLELSPDGRHLAVFEIGDGLPAPDEGRARTGTPTRALGVALVDLDTGTVKRPAGVRNVFGSLLNWSPDGSALLVYRPGEGPDGQDGQFLTVGRDGGVQPVITDDIHPEIEIDGFGAPVAQAGWIGKRPLILGRPAGSERPDWWLVRPQGPSNMTRTLRASGRLRALGTSRALVQSPDGLVVLSDAASGSAEVFAGRPISGPSDGGLRSATDPMGASTLAVRSDEGRLCRFDLDAAATPTCMDDQSHGDPVAISWSTKSVISRGLTENGVLDLDLHQDGAPPVALARINTFLAHVDFPRPRRIASDDVTGWIYLPRGAGPDCPAPVVVIPYPGTSFPTDPPGMRPGRARAFFNPNLLVEAGYAVIFPDLPTSDGPAGPGASLGTRLDAILDAAAAAYPVDPERAGLWGWSFGGWAVVETATRTRRFKAVVALNGPMNLAGRLGATASPWRLAGDAGANIISNAGWLETGQARMHAPPWRDTKRYLSNSPVLKPDQVHAAVLLMVTDQDASLTDGEAMFASLYRLNRPAELVTFYGESHALSSPANLRAMYAKTTAWFDRYLAEGDSTTPAPTNVFDVPDYRHGRGTGPTGRQQIPASKCPAIGGG